MRITPFAQTLTLAMTGTGVLMFCAAILRGMQNRITFNEILFDEKLRSLRNELRLHVEKSQAESARTTMEYQLKYKHSEEFKSLRSPESYTALEPPL